MCAVPRAEVNDVLPEQDWFVFYVSYAALTSRFLLLFDFALCSRFFPFLDGLLTEAILFGEFFFLSLSFTSSGKGAH